MPWFQKLCRQSGLLIHQIAKPVEKPRDEPTLVLRRTTVVEEVELPSGGREGPKNVPPLPIRGAARS